MARIRLRSQREVVDHCRLLREELQAALARLPGAAEEAEVVDAVWSGEALGTLLWALQLVELPPYDRPFDSEAVATADLAEAELRDAEEIDLERESARLWHWRARTGDLHGDGDLELPSRFESLDQLVAATAMRGYEEGLLPAPLRGDFHAYGRSYRQLTPAEHVEAHSLAAERHLALAWLTDPRTDWDDIRLDT
jgi:hypothetical protein